MTQQVTQFRQWATRTLKDHLVQGYPLHQQHLAERGIDFEQALSLLARTLNHPQRVVMSNPSEATPC